MRRRVGGIFAVGKSLPPLGSHRSHAAEATNPRPPRYGRPLTWIGVGLKEEEGHTYDIQGRRKESWGIFAVGKSLQPLGSHRSHAAEATNPRPPHYGRPLTWIGVGLKEEEGHDIQGRRKVVLKVAYERARNIWLQYTNSVYKSKDYYFLKLVTYTDTKLIDFKKIIWERPTL